MRTLFLVLSLPFFVLQLEFNLLGGVLHLNTYFHQYLLTNQILKRYLPKEAMKVNREGNFSFFLHREPFQTQEIHHISIS